MSAPDGLGRFRSATYEATCLDCGAFYVTDEVDDAWQWMDEHEASGEHACRMTATVHVSRPGRRSSRREP